MLAGELLLLGGAGTLGRAIIKRATEEKWDCKITIFSCDVLKHHKIKRLYPRINSIGGDIRDFTGLLNAMTGKDIVLHLAARKHIPESEYNSVDTIDVNVTGSLNVCQAAMQLGIPHVIGISTDKAARPVNCYGATKMLMEKIFQEYSRLGIHTQYHLVRYGNVLESNGSVIEVWRRAFASGEPIRITNAGMTRFWLSPSQAVQYVVDAYGIPNGHILIPKLSALSLGKLAKYTIPGLAEQFFETVPVRPGEKVHETLLTEEEGWYAWEGKGDYILAPTTSPRRPDPLPAYSSDIAPELTQEELARLLKDG